MLSLQALYNEWLSWGISRKFAPILAEIKYRKSQVPSSVQPGGVVVGQRATASVFVRQGSLVQVLLHNR
jgi:hypothetical protein